MAASGGISVMGQGKEGKPGRVDRLREAASLDGHLALWHHLLAGANQCGGVLVDSLGQDCKPTPSLFLPAFAGPSTAILRP